LASTNNAAVMLGLLRTSANFPRRRKRSRETREGRRRQESNREKINTRKWEEKGEEAWKGRRVGKEDGEWTDTVEVEQSEKDVKEK